LLLALLALGLASQAGAQSRKGGTGVVVVPGHGTGVVTGGTLHDPHGLGHGAGPVVWWSVYNTPTGPPETKSPFDGLEVKPAGRLHLVVDPPDAHVWVDGNPMPPGADASIGLLTGAYTIQVARDGYLTQSHQISIEQAKTAQLQVKLEPAKE
jgi:hypothetical protein